MTIRVNVLRPVSVLGLVIVLVIVVRVVIIALRIVVVVGPILMLFSGMLDVNGGKMRFDALGSLRDHRLDLGQRLLLSAIQGCPIRYAQRVEETSHG